MLDSAATRRPYRVDLLVGLICSFYAFHCGIAFCRDLLLRVPIPFGHNMHCIMIASDAGNGICLRERLSASVHSLFTERSH